MHHRRDGLFIRRRHAMRSSTLCTCTADHLPESLERRLVFPAPNGQGERHLDVGAMGPADESPFVWRFRSKACQRV